MPNSFVPRLALRDATWASPTSSSRTSKNFECVEAVPADRKMRLQLARASEVGAHD